ncbi:hypothetical protein ACTA71_000840 [Dictyostelium dimigraforme]
MKGFYIVAGFEKILAFLHFIRFQNGFGDTNSSLMILKDQFEFQSEYDVQYCCYLKPTNRNIKDAAAIDELSLLTFSLFALYAIAFTYITKIYFVFVLKRFHSPITIIAMLKMIFICQR